MPAPALSGLPSFVATLPRSVLDDLTVRLRRTRWPDPAPGEPWVLGTDLTYLQELCHWWSEEFSWAAVESDLAQFAHVRPVIDGQPLHALVATSPRSDAVPLLLVHGWPSTVLEFTRIIRLLTEPEGDQPAFHVVCPSLPGFAWSGPTLEAGWTPRRMAIAIDSLMGQLGCGRYFVQGGDWGAMVASQLGAIVPERVWGIHLIMAVVSKPPGAAPLTDDEAADMSAMKTAAATENGYQAIQATRPQSLGVGLQDSPAGLAAWIVEKFRAWGDCDDGLEPQFPRWWLAATATVFWATGTATSAARLYAESRRGGSGSSRPDGKVEVPTAYSRFGADPFRFPVPWVEAAYDLRQYRHHAHGGHFAAFEEPEALAGDVADFAASLL